MNKPSKSTLLIRALVAGYLLYLAYGLIQDYNTSQNHMVMVIAIIVFVLCGGVILITSLRSLMKGDYEDAGSADEQMPEDGGESLTQKDGQDIEEETKDTE